VTRLRRDPVSGRWVALAETRGARPGGGRPAVDDPLSCPFCGGHEDETPPATLRLGDGPTGWDVRVVPNLYGAVERHEVVIHGPRHRHSLAELPDGTLDLVAEAWQRRAHDAGGTLLAFVNEGWDAGASLPHSHSQLAWLPEPPPAVTAERGLPEVVPVLERDGLVAGCPLRPSPSRRGSRATCSRRRFASSPSSSGGWSRRSGSGRRSTRGCTTEPTGTSS
jgi:hypothetical protein